MSITGRVYCGAGVNRVNIRAGDWKDDASQTLISDELTAAIPLGVTDGGSADAAGLKPSVRRRAVWHSTGMHISN